MQSPFETISLAALPLGPVLWLLLALVVVVFGIYSAILMWHWKEYSTGKYTTVANIFVYLGVGVALLITMALAALMYGV